MSSSRKTKYDKLIAVSRKLGENFARIDHPDTQYLAKLFGGAGEGDDSFEELKKREPSVTRSQIAAGMEQGLRDLSMMLPAQDPKIRSAAMSAFRDALDSEYPEFLERDKQRLAKVLARGQVRTESEWYLLQSRLDEIEGDPEFEQETTKLWELIDNYAG